MQRKRSLNISVPADLREWFEKEAGARRMTMSDLAVDLWRKGIQAETIDQSVARLEAAMAPDGVTRQLLRQVLSTRFMVEQLARSGSTTPMTTGYEANAYADRELAKLWPGPQGEGST